MRYRGQCRFWLRGEKIPIPVMEVVVPLADIRSPSRYPIPMSEDYQVSEMHDARPAARRQPRVVVIDDDPLLLKLVKGVLDPERFTIATAETGRSGVELVKQIRPDVVVLDNLLPDLDGLLVLQQIRQLDGQLPILFITAQQSSQTAIEAMKRGAFDYLSKPLDLEKLEEQVEHAVEARRLMRVPVVLGDADPAQDLAGDSLIGRCEAMQEVYKAIGRITQQDVPVLISGEPGTGKELVARAIYQNGSRASAPFQIVKCADFASPWLESELFGHEEGAFVGAVGKRIGRFEQCANGLVVLEEIGQTSPALQSKLFRLLSSQEFERVGGTDTIRAHVGIIATTSQQLERLMEQGQFRADLYYLLSSFTIFLPPLRDRVADLPLLVDHFVKKISHISRSFGGEVVRVSSEALSLLTQYRWPGNLDEMQSVLRRALIETKGAVLASDFLTRTLTLPLAESPHLAQLPRGSMTDWQQFCSQRLAAGTEELYAQAVTEMEMHLLERVLAATSGNQARAAKILGITRGNLRKKIRNLGIVLPGATTHALASDDSDAEASDGDGN